MRSVTRAAEQKFADLESQLAVLRERVERLESSQRSGEWTYSETEPTHPPTGIGTEYWIGARLLPRAGAVLIVLAIAFVAISETSKNPLLDRAWLLALEALFCVVFIAVGEWKRDELEGFGKTLTAIGSCGLYLTAAGGHFAYHTLTAAAMAGVFALLSLVNHGYAVWRTTRLFFFIGALGGLAAMLFPLAEKDFTTGLAVYVTVTVAAAVACALRKWSRLAIGGWLLGLFILYPAIDSSFPRWAVLLALYVGSLACITAYVRSVPTDEVDAWALGAPIALFVTGLIGFLVVHDSLAVLHLVALAAGGIAIGFLYRRQNGAAQPLVIGSVATLAALGPLGYQPFIAVTVYSLLAVTCLLSSARLGRKICSIFSTAAFIAAASTYSIAVLAAPMRHQSILLALLLAAMVSASLALRAAGLNWIGLLVGGGWAVLARWAFLLSPVSQTSLATFSLPTLVTVAYALTLLLVGFRVKSGQVRMWSMGVMLVGAVQILFLETGTSAPFRLVSLVALGAIMLVGGNRYIKDRQRQGAEGVEPTPQTALVSQEPLN